MKTGDTVWILGWYAPCGPTKIIEAQISHIQHRQWVAYTVDGPGEWHFSKRHVGKSVFEAKSAAETALGAGEGEQ